MKKTPKYKIFAYISFGFLGLMMLLLCAMGVSANLTGGVGMINDLLKIAMYVAFGISAVFFFISYVLDLKRRSNDRK